MVNILVTGVGCPGGPGIIKAFKKNKNNRVIGIDINKNASGAIFCDKFIIKDRSASKKFKQKIFKIIKKNKINYILPLVTKELPFFSKHKEMIKRIFNCNVIVSDYKTIKTSNDKIELYKFFKKIKLQTPLFSVAKSPSILKEKIKEFINKKKICVIKPGISNGSRGIRILKQENNELKKIINDKPGNLELSANYFSNLLHMQKIPRYLISEYLPGTEISVDTIIFNKKIYLILMRTRDRINSGISISGRFIYEKKVYKIIEKLASYLDFYGPVGFQFKKNIKDIYHLIECNPRIQGSSMSSMAFNINFAQQIINVISGKSKVTKKIFKNKRFTRYYEEVFYDN
jgi:carbamoyl-phosphate synthase large subunit